MHENVRLFWLFLNWWSIQYYNIFEIINKIFFWKALLIIEMLSFAIYNSLAYSLILWFVLLILISKFSEFFRISISFLLQIIDDFEYHVCSLRIWFAEVVFNPEVELFFGSWEINNYFFNSILRLWFNFLVALILVEILVCRFLRLEL